MTRRLQVDLLFAVPILIQSQRRNTVHVCVTHFVNIYMQFMHTNTYPAFAPRGRGQTQWNFPPKSMYKSSFIISNTSPVTILPSGSPSCISFEFLSSEAKLCCSAAGFWLRWLTLSNMSKVFDNPDASLTWVSLPLSPTCCWNIPDNLALGEVSALDVCSLESELLFGPDVDEHERLSAAL